MSKVYSFRLDENNPREAQAREVIEALASEGYSIRHIVVNALVQFGNNESDKSDLEEILETIKQLLTPTKKEGSVINNAREELQTAFIGSITKSVKGGLKIKN
jgi:hypothetical protein